MQYANNILHIFCEPGSSNLLVCISPTVIYPDFKNCILDSFSGNSKKYEDCINLNPFIINLKNQLEYRTDIKSILGAAQLKNTSSIGFKIEIHNLEKDSYFCYVSIRNITDKSISYRILAQGIFSR